MQDNFLLSEQAKALKPREAAALGRDEAYERFKDVRWGWTGGLAVCPHCDYDRIYEHNNRLTFKCRRCGRHFSVTSLTPFHSRKLSFGQLLLLVSLRLRGQNAMAISQEMNVNYRTAWAQKKKLVILGNGGTRTRDRVWPYRPDDARADEGLAGKVAKLTAGLPWQMRGDVAQEMILGVLSGETTVEELAGSVRKYMRKYYRVSEAFGNFSWETPLADGRRWDELISTEQGLWSAIR